MLMELELDTCWDWHPYSSTDISETGNIGMKGETRGDRDEQRGVRDVTEIGTDLGNRKV